MRGRLLRKFHGELRLYADDGRGFAIGLSARLFAIENSLGNIPTQNVFVSPVFYTPFTSQPENP